MKIEKVSNKSATIHLARPVVADQDSLPNVVDMLETSLRAANDEIMTLRGENSELKKALAQRDASAVIAAVVSEEGIVEHTGCKAGIDPSCSGDLQCSQKGTNPTGSRFMGKIKRAFSWK